MDIDTDRIVDGVDGPAPTAGALRYAVRIAGALDAPLGAVITWTEPPFTGAELVIERQPERDASQALDESVQVAFGSSPPDGLVRTVWSGPVTRTLIDLSKTSGMLVPSSRGHGGFAGLLLGSVSATCAEHAHSPVLIVHPHRNSAKPARPTETS